HGWNRQWESLHGSGGYQRSLSHPGADPDAAGASCHCRFRRLVPQRRSRWLDRSATHSCNMGRLPPETCSATASGKLARRWKRSLLKPALSVLATFCRNERQGRQAVSFVQLRSMIERLFQGVPDKRLPPLQLKCPDKSEIEYNRFHAPVAQAG